MSVVVETMQAFKAALLSREAAQMQSMTRRWRALEEALQDRIEVFAARVAQDGLTVGQIQSRQFQLDRYASLLRQVQREHSGYVDYADGLIQAGQRQAGASGINAAAAAIRAIGVRSGFDILPINVIENMVGLAGDGSPLQQLLQNSFGAAADGMLNQLIRATALGYNPQRTARMMVRDGLSQSLSRMMNISRTEQLRVFREGSRQQYQASGVVENYRRLATKDRRTCPACMMADGEVMELGESLKAHPSCRCTSIPTVMGFKPVQWERGPDWFAKQAPDVQRQILGPGRFNAWKDGRFDLDQLITEKSNGVWGNSLHPTPLRDLLSGNVQPYNVRLLDPNRPVTPLPQRIAEPPPEPEPLPSDGFPADLAGIERVKTLGGSTGAELVRDPATGKLYVKKKGNNPGHLLEETYADAAYQALGVNVPKFKLYSDNGQPVKLAEFMEGRSLAEIKQSDPKLYAKAVKALQKDFAADALLGNWDVVGLSADNILVDKSGTPWRIDNGGSLRYRAQGALKTEFSSYVDELWTLRNPRINQQTAETFGGVGFYDLTKQMKALEKRRAELLAALPVELQGPVAARLDNLKDVTKISDLFKKDSFVESYTDNFAKHSVGLRKAGLIDGLPKKLTNSGVEVFDENGKRWDNYRGSDSIIGKLAGYMQRNGGDYERTIPYWAGQQAIDSWTNGAQAAKYFYAGQRNVDDAFWWKFGKDKASEAYEKAKSIIGADAYHETLTAWHAFNYEFMRNTAFKNNNLKKGVVKLIRTENIDVMGLNNMQKGDTKTIKRGAVESYSVFKKVSVFGSEETVQEIPHHRIFGNYMLERSPGSNHGMFLGDNENEIVAMTEGVKVTYVK